MHPLYVENQLMPLLFEQIQSNQLKNRLYRIPPILTIQEDDDSGGYAQTELDFELNCHQVNEC